MIKANHRTSFPDPLSGIKGTIKEPAIGNNIERLSQGKLAVIVLEVSMVPKFKVVLSRNSKTSKIYQHVRSVEILRVMASSR